MKADLNEHRQSIKDSAHHIRDQTEEGGISKQRQKLTRKFAEKPPVTNEKKVTSSRETAKESPKIEKNTPSFEKQKNDSYTQFSPKKNPDSKEKKSKGSYTQKDEKKKPSRFQFTKEEITAPVKAGTNAVLLTGAAVVHEQMKDGEEDNAAIDAADSALTTTGTVRLVHQHHKSRSHDESEKSQRLTHEEEQTSRIHFESNDKAQKAVYALILSNTLNRQPKTPKPVKNWGKNFGFKFFMSFFSSTVSTMSTAIIAVGAGLAVWGGINLLEGYVNDNPGANAHVR